MTEDKYRECKRIAFLIFKHLHGLENNEDVEQLNKWREEDKAHESLYCELLNSSNLEQLLNGYIEGTSNKEDKWEAIVDRTIKKDKKHIRLFSKTILKYAAVFALPLLFASYFIWNYTRHQLNEVNDDKFGSVCGINLTIGNGETIDLRKSNADSTLIKKGEILSVNKDNLVYGNNEVKSDIHTLSVPRGITYKLTLADGSLIVLNSGSKITYPSSFVDAESRSVFLDGEAYFDIVHDSLKPFVVNTGLMQVRVLGTVFNIKSYSQDNEIYTTLVSGSVGIYANGKNITIEPNIQATYKKDDGSIDLKTVDTDYIIAWKNNKILYDQTPLVQIMEDLSRMYDYDVIFDDEELKDIAFTMNIDKSDDVQHILSLIQSTDKVKIRWQNDIIVIYK